jgi:hypothetical protein
LIFNIAKLRTLHELFVRDNCHVEISLGIGRAGWVKKPIVIPDYCDALSEHRATQIKMFSVLLVAPALATAHFNQLTILSDALVNI